MAWQTSVGMGGSGGSAGGGSEAGGSGGGQPQGTEYTLQGERKLEADFASRIRRLPGRAIANGGLT
jgi:hypothetical protein